MSLLSFIRLLLRFKWLLITAPFFSLGLVFLMLRGQPDSYESRTVVYTGLVSGFNIESGSDSQLDYHVVNSGFDNLINTIKSRETLLRASTEALAQISCRGAYGKMAEEEWYSDLVASVQQGSGSRDCQDQLTWIQEASYDVTSPIYGLIFRSKTTLALESLLANLSVQRIASSDLMEIKFTAPDPDLAQEMLSILNASFIERYQRIKRREVGSVVQFFENETSRSYGRLQVAVAQMRDFGAKNRVINYYEQTKAIAGQKELIDQQIQQETMRLESAESAVLDLENRIGASQEIREKGIALVELRQRYTDKTVQNVLGASRQGSTGAPEAALAVLENEIEQSVAALYNARYSKEGFVKTELVERWLDEMVTIAESRASLDVLVSRRDEYIKVYDEFAPMGSTLSTLEREVDVAESEYLELLHSLNQARMRQQNIEMSSSMDVLDQPNFPQEPLSSKLHLMMLAGFMATFMLCLATITSAEILDQSLRAPENARRRTGMDLMGFLPDTGEGKLDGHQQLNYDMCINNFTSRLITYMAQQSDKSTHLICLVSVADGDGKTYTGDRLEQALQNTGRKVIRLSPGESKAARENHHGYQINPLYATRDSVSDLMKSSLSEKVVILMELPALSQNELPVKLLQNATSVVWVAGANSVWSDHESTTLEFVRSVSGVEPRLCLNRVKWDRLDGSLGGVIKNRSGVRKLVKKLLQRNFS